MGHYGSKHAFWGLLFVVFFAMLCVFAGKYFFAGKTVSAVFEASPFGLLTETVFAKEEYTPKTLFDADGITLEVKETEEPELLSEGLTELLLSVTPTAAVEKEEMPADGKKVSALTVKGTASQLNWKNVYIKNPTSYKVDPASLAAATPSWKFTDSGPQILIIHTHGSESYNTHGGDWYLASDASRSLDTTQNVVCVGAVIAKVLTEKGYRVLHSTTLYDQPTYSTSYSSALKGINAYLKKYPSIRMVIDVHRDSMTSSDGTKYKLLSEVNGEQCAQMMLVMGTGESGLSFPDWKQNLSFAVKLQQAILEKYPTLMRPIAMTRHRYNEHATPASVILEVGTDGNTLEEACAAAGYFGEVLGDFLRSYY